MSHQSRGGSRPAPPSLRDLLTDLLWWPVLTFSTVAPMLAGAYNFQHPDMTQMRVLLSAGEWYWWPFSGYVAIAWAVVLIWRRIRTARRGLTP